MTAPAPKRINTVARSITAVMFTAGGIAWAFYHPEHSWEGWLVALVGGGVVAPEILEGLTKLRR